MKKIHLFLFFCFFGLSLFAQSRTDTVYFQGRYSKNKIYKIIQIEGRQSKITVFNEQGFKTEYFALLDGLKEGKAILYNHNGKISQSAYYHKGLKEGVETIYFNNNKRKSQTEYSANHRLGPFKTWSEGGMLLQKGCYDTISKRRGDQFEVLEVLNGKNLAYNSLGKKERQCNYVKGNLEGLCKEWYSNGSIKSMIEYRNGVVFGKEETWYENGNRRFQGYTYHQAPSHGNYIKPKQEGKQINYFENGTISSLQIYHHFLPHGTWLRYSEPGRLAEQKTFVNGQLIEPDITYYDNGKIYQEFPHQIFHLNGRDTSFLHGLYKSYYSNGNKMQETKYEKGRQYGLHTQYFENGKIERQLYFLGAENKYALLKEFNSNGQLLKEGTYSIDKIDSTRFRKLIYAVYAENGQLIYKMNHVDANAAGSFEAYFENGNLMVEGFIFKKNNAEYISVDDMGTAWQALYYPNGALRCEVITIDNFRHGQYVEWFPDGSLKRFIDPNGLDIQWLQNGEMMTTLVYNTENNLIRDTLLSRSYLNQLYTSLTSTPVRQLKLWRQSDGMQTSFYATGKKHLQTQISRGDFDQYFLAYTYTGDTLVYMGLQNGLLNGKYLLKNVNGSLLSSGFYEAGKEIGEWKIHNKKGLPRSYYAYEPNGQDPKPFIYEYTFYESGVLESKSEFIRGKKNGWYLSYHPNGKLHDSIFFSLDTLNGRCVSYTEEGKPFSSYFYEKGKKQGLHQQWYYKDYGSGIMRKEWYSDNLRQGEAKYYHPNGQLSLTGYYKNDRQDSIWTYFDTLGLKQKTDYYLDGIKRVEALSGKCACRDMEPGKSFAQSLKSLLSEETDLSLWQFPYHQRIDEVIDHCFFSNLQVSNNRSSSYYNFQLISFKPIKLGIPNKNGMKLWLNPCWHTGEESKLELGVNITQRQPDLTQVDMFAERMAYVLPPRIFKSVQNNSLEILAHFKALSVSYDRGGIHFKDAQSICTDDAYLLTGNYLLNLDTFSLMNVVSIYDDDYLLRNLSFYGYNLLEREILKKLGSDPILIQEGRGTLKINIKNNRTEAQITQVLISPKLVAGFIQIPGVKIENGKLWVEQKNGGFELNEQEFYTQMKLDGFSKIVGQYNPELKTLEVLFYIHKPQ